MPGYISEVSYSGMHSAEFVEIAVPKGTDVSGYTVQIYESYGTLHDTVSLGSITQTVDQKDVYVINSATVGFDDLENGDAVALVDDLGNVVQFISFGGTVTAINGDASGLTSTAIGTAGMGKSLQSDDDGTSYYVQSSTNEGTIPCYAPGTLIDTPDGPRPVETLQPGDLVETLDHGAMPVRWARRGDRALEGAAPDAWPILIQAGAFGAGCPARDLVVSPQHRILVGAAGQLDRIFEGQCFAPAKALTGLPMIRAMMGKRRITWVHFALAGHQVVRANGCYSESLLLGPMVLNGMTALQQRGLRDIFGPPRGGTGAALNGPAARDCLTVGQVRRILQAGRARRELSAVSA